MPGVGIIKKCGCYSREGLLRGNTISDNVAMVEEHKIHFSVFDSGQIARACLPLSFGQLGAMIHVQFFSTFIPLLRPSVAVVVIKTLDGAVVGRVIVH